MGEFNIVTGEMIRGDLPAKAQALVMEWMEVHKDELQNMWEKQSIYKLPPLL